MTLSYDALSIIENTAIGYNELVKNLNNLTIDELKESFEVGKVTLEYTQKLLDDIEKIIKEREGNNIDKANNNGEATS